MRKDTHTAAPATSPAAPSSAKMPAPTIAPTPMNDACRTVRYFWVDDASVMSATPCGRFRGLRHPISGACGDVGARNASHDAGDVTERADRRPAPSLARKATRRLDLRPHGPGGELAVSQFLGCHVGELALL